MSDRAVKTMTTNPQVLPIQSIEFNRETYIISQMRICRYCRIPMEITEGNHRLYFDKENRIALHEHIQCPISGYFGNFRK